MKKILLHNVKHWYATCTIVSTLGPEHTGTMQDFHDVRTNLTLRWDVWTSARSSAELAPFHWLQICNHVTFAQKRVLHLRSGNLQRPAHRWERHHSLICGHVLHGPRAKMIHPFVHWHLTTVHSFLGEGCWMDRNQTVTSDIGSAEVTTACRCWTMAVIHYTQHYNTKTDSRLKM